MDGSHSFQVAVHGIHPIGKIVVCCKHRCLYKRHAAHMHAYVIVVEYLYILGDIRIYSLEYAMMCAV